MNSTTSVAASASAFAAFAAAASASAFAADLPARTAPTGLPLLATGWQGFYLGGSLGGSWLNSHVDDTMATPLGAGYGTAVGSDTSASKFGSLAGVQAGFNLQSRNLVYGVEADFSFLGGKTSVNGVHTTTSTGYYGYSQAGATTKKSRVSDLATLRARIGADFNGTMPYLTAGLALGRVKDSYQYTSGYGSSSSDETKWRTGFAVGGGIEHKITDNVSIRGEVLWVGFADRSRTIPAAWGTNGGGSVRSSSNLTLGKIGMNYHF
jgi:outer membrane immunogenic protein